MSNARIPPNKWIKILAFLRKCPDVRVGNEENCKRFIEAMMWMARAGAPWRMLPSEYGNWNSVYKRFARWSDRGVWQRMHDAFIEEPDMAFILIDSTIVRANQAAAGASRKRGGQESQDLGKSRGGFSTKIHIAVDKEGKPLRCILTGGEKHDITQSDKLIAGLVGGCVIADKGYDSNAFVELIEASGMEAVIPPRSNRKSPREYDGELYKERNIVERFINKIKNYRKIACRFDKLAQRYLGFLQFISAFMWI